MPHTTPILNRNEALAFLQGRIDYERAGQIPYRSCRFKLDRMQELLARLGDPHQSLPIVHIAGTKGKGSTAGMIASVLTAAGYRTGLYTSPHLEQLEERFTIDHSPCSGAELAELLAQVRQVSDAMDREAAAGGRYESGPTYFEITTAMALLHFSRRSVDAAVLEVGLGGRLDSTNVCRPLVSVITSISYDHTQQLGDTLASIAREKAGIIKPGVTVISGVTQEAPRRVIETTARRRGSQLLRLGRDFHFAYRPPSADALARAESDHGGPPWGAMDYWDAVGEAPRRFGQLSLGLLGKHQAANAAVALAALGRLQSMGWRTPEEAVRRGLRDVRCPARIEIVGRRPAVVIDAAHNVASIAALLDVLDDGLSAGLSAGGRVLVFAASKDKDIAGMLRCLLPKFQRVILTRFLNNPRAASTEELADAARSAAAEAAGNGQPAADPMVRPDPVSAWEAARASAGPDDLICVAGSFFLAAEIRRLVLAERETAGKCAAEAC